MDPANLDAKKRSATNNGIIAVVLSVLAFIICWIPCLNLLALPMAIIGLILGIISVRKARGTDANKAPGTVGIVLSSLALLIVFGFMAIIGVSIYNNETDGFRITEDGFDIGIEIEQPKDPAGKPDTTERLSCREMLSEFEAYVLACESIYQADSSLSASNRQFIDNYDKVFGYFERGQNNRCFNEATLANRYNQLFVRLDNLWQRALGKSLTKNLLARPYISASMEVDTLQL